MTRGKRRKLQLGLWMPAVSLARSSVPPFYELLSRLLVEGGFGDSVEKERAGSYAPENGRPSLTPGEYFRLFPIGYFEDIDSERGIACRVVDSITLREFLSFELSNATADHSTISVTSRLIDLETHQAILDWVVRMLARTGLIKGTNLEIDTTTLEANGALSNIARPDTGESYHEFLERLAKAPGIETPVREGLSRLAHKADNVIDMDSGVSLAVLGQPVDRRHTSSVETTLEEVTTVFEDVLSNPEAKEQQSDRLRAELFADQGCCSNTVRSAQQESGVRTYIRGPSRGRRDWCDRKDACRAAHGSRRRIRETLGQRLLRRHGGFLERPSAHCYRTEGMRQPHLQGHSSIRKRLLIQHAAFNLGLLMRRRFGFGTADLPGPLSRPLVLLRTIVGLLGRHDRRRKPSGPIDRSRGP